jgi:hypothetical protein
VVFKPERIIEDGHRAVLFERKTCYAFYKNTGFDLQYGGEVTLE